MFTLQALEGRLGLLRQAQAQQGGGGGAGPVSDFTSQVDSMVALMAGDGGALAAAARRQAVETLVREGDMRL